MHMNNNCHNINKLMINPGGQPEESLMGLICYCVQYKGPYLGKVSTHLSKLSGNNKIATSSLTNSWKAKLAAASVNGGSFCCDTQRWPIPATKVASPRCLYLASRSSKYWLIKAWFSTTLLLASYPNSVSCIIFPFLAAAWAQTLKCVGSII